MVSVNIPFVLKDNLPVNQVKKNLSEFIIRLYLSSIFSFWKNVCQGVKAPQYYIVFISEIDYFSAIVLCPDVVFCV